MSHNEEHTRCQLIGACAASAQSSMDAATVEITRAGDADAMELVSEIRQRLGELERRYPCERGHGRTLGGD
jgi:hypothetical protein